MTTTVINPESPWLTRQEAAAYLRVCPETLDTMVKAGCLRAHRAGSRILRFRREDLDQALTPTTADPAA
jgi:excisionase family DNA binding protein